MIDRFKRIYFSTLRLLILLSEDADSLYLKEKKIKKKKVINNVKYSSD